MLKKVYKFIDSHVRDNPMFQVVCFLLCWTIMFFIFFFYMFDTTPATQNDYKPLIEQKDSIIKDFNTVYTYDNYIISPDGDNVTVTLSNKQCELLCSFDNTLKFINYKQLDLADCKLNAILGSIFLGFVLGGSIGLLIVATFIPFILSYLFKFLEWIFLLLVGK